MNNVNTFFAKRSYASLGAGTFTIAASRLNELVDAECFIVYTDTGLGNTFAVRNISITPVDENNVRITFDPLTDVHAMPANALPKDSLTGSLIFLAMGQEEMQSVPRLLVSSDASGNNPNMLSLDLECRQRLHQYKGGLITLTELCLTLHEKGIHVVDIDNNVRQKDHPMSVFAQYPRTAIELNKDNGVEEGSQPVLARMSVLL